MCAINQQFIKMLFKNINDLVTALNKVTGYALDASGKSTSIKANSGTYTITVADGVVQRTTAPDGSSVDD